MPLDEYGLSEEPVIEVFEDLGYEHKRGKKISLEGKNPERKATSQVVLRGRLKRKLKEFNPSIPDEAIQSAISTLLSSTSPKILVNNKRFHKKLVEGVSVEYKEDGEIVGDRVKVVDFENPENNDFLIVNQLYIQIGRKPPRRPDVLVFLNGLPIGIFELKDPTNPKAPVEVAFKQVTDRYMRDISHLFDYNEFIVVADKNDARVGCLSSDWEWYSLWNYIKEEGDTHPEMAPVEVLVRGLFNKERMLGVLKDYIIFDEEGGKLSKKLAMYHQYYAVEKAVGSTLETVPNPKDRRIGTVWHAQGSGKSLSMVFYVKKIRKLKELNNPTIVIITDRNSLDEQIHETFAEAGFRTSWAESIEDLRDKLDRETGGIIFTTIQKFQTKEEEQKFPKINERQNIIVIADEAHRSQYKKLARKMRKRALPNASFIGFTATPIELEQRSTYTAFGEYISKYTIDQSEKDGSTVPIYIESRMAKLHLADKEIEEKFRKLMESKSDDLKHDMTREWTSLRKIIENKDERLKKIAKDIVKHYNNRDLEGKAMVVTISRKAAVKYKRYIEEVPNSPEVAVVISNPGEYIENPRDEETLKRRFKDPDDSLKIVVVCGKWITGFDVPPLHTMYIDKPMKNHTLMQAIARVNRVYKDKPGGLIVDYIGIGDNLKKAMDKYTSEMQNQVLKRLDEAIEIMREAHKEVADLFEKTDYEGWKEKRGLRLQRLIHQAENEILESEEKKEKFMDSMNRLLKAYSLVSPHDAALEISSDVVFFKAVKRSIEKTEVPPDEEWTLKEEKMDSAMKELISEGISVSEIVETASIEPGERKHILSDEFLEEVEDVEYENIRAKLLEKLIRNEISRRKIRNRTRYKSFEKRLEKTISKYNDNLITTEYLIKELKNLAKDLREEKTRTEKLGLDEQEIAFYDAVASESGDIDKEKLKEIAQRLKKKLKENAEIDWANRMKMRSKMRSEVKRILRSEGFTHNRYEPMIEPVVRQAEAFYGREFTVSKDFERNSSHFRGNNATPPGAPF